LAGGLEFDLEFEVAAVVTLGGIDAALEVHEWFGGIPFGAGEGVVAVLMAIEALGPHVGFRIGAAFEPPGVADEGGYKDVLLGSGGLKTVVVAGVEGLQVGGVFAGNDRVGGEEAVFESIETDGGLAFGGAGSSGFDCVEAVGLDLFESTHTDSRVAGGFGGRRAWEA